MNFFNPEQQPWAFLGRCVDFVGLSLCCVFCSLGVVTLGPSLAALYTSLVKAFRYGDNTPFREFFRVFRKEFKKGVILTLISVPVLLLIAYGYYVMKTNSSDRTGAFMFTFYYVLLILPVGTMLNLFPLLGRFDLSIKDYIKTAFSLTIAHLPSTLVIVLLSVELTIWTLEYWSPAFVTPSIWALLSSFFLENNYKKHLSEEECAKLEGITVEEYRKKEEERKKVRGFFRGKKK